jgi:hypothetical protein
MNLGKNAEVPRQKCGGWWEAWMPGRPHYTPLNSPPAPASPSAPDHCPPPTANTRPPDPPTGTGPRPTAGLSDVETASL